MLTQSVVGVPPSLGLVFPGIVGVLGRDEAQVAVAGQVAQRQARLAPLPIHQCLEFVALV